MAFEISPVEHGQILADIKHLKEDAKQLNERVDDLEKKARHGNAQHLTTSGILGCTIG